MQMLKWYLYYPKYVQVIRILFALWWWCCWEMAWLMMIMMMLMLWMMRLSTMRNYHTRYYDWTCCGICWCLCVAPLLMLEDVSKQLNNQQKFTLQFPLTVWCSHSNIIRKVVIVDWLCVVRCFDYVAQVEGLNTYCAFQSGCVACLRVGSVYVCVYSCRACVYLLRKHVL